MSLGWVKEGLNNCKTRAGKGSSGLKPYQNEAEEDEQLEEICWAEKSLVVIRKVGAFLIISVT